MESKKSFVWDGCGRNVFRDEERPLHVPTWYRVPSKSVSRVKLLVDDPRSGIESVTPMGSVVCLFSRDEGGLYRKIKDIRFMYSFLYVV